MDLRWIRTNDGNWMRQLQRNPNTGAYEKTIDNVWVVLEHDPQLRGKFALNEFANRGEVFGRCRGMPGKNAGNGKTTTTAGRIGIWRRYTVLPEKTKWMERCPYTAIVTDSMKFGIT